jgi:squalene synthase HpnC
MTVEHYENFPVASVLLPRWMRRAVLDIYRFARSADDLADEGTHEPGWRLEALAGYRRQLAEIARGRTPEEPLFCALATTIRAHRVPLQPLEDLLSAFEQDVRQSRYETYDELLAYCDRSANPVGRLLLHLHGTSGAQAQSESDAICTALQLTNFWQDLAIDLQKDRIYLPRRDMSRFGVTEEDLRSGECNARFVQLMRYQVGRTRSLMLDGAPLAPRVGGRFGYELRLVIAGGLRILERIEQAGCDVFRHRPVLGARDWALVLARGLIPARRASKAHAR